MIILSYPQMSVLCHRLAYLKMLYFIILKQIADVHNNSITVYFFIYSDYFVWV